MTPQPTIETRRLILRPFTLADAETVQRLAGRREIADTTLRIPHPYPDGAAEAWIASRPGEWRDGRGVTWGITRRDDLAVIGAIGLAFDPAAGSAELGYWLDVDAWNRGYTTEAARAVLDLAFSHFALHRVEARHLVRNPASGRVLTKIGMRPEGVLRDAVRKWGRYEDVALLAILADEWRPDTSSDPR